MAQSANKTIDLPDFATAGELCKQYAAVLSKEAELRSRREEINREIAEIRSRNPNGFGIMAEVAPPKPNVEKSESPVSKLLGAFAPKKVDHHATGDEADMERSRELSIEGGQIDDARHILDDPRLLMHRKASREYCELIIDDYRPFAASVAQAIIALGEAIEQHDAFVSEVQRREVQSSYLMIVERPRWSHIVRWLKSAVDGGHLDARAIPDEWRAKA